MTDARGFWTILEEVAPSTPERQIWRFSTRASDLATVVRAHGLPSASEEFLMDRLQAAAQECPNFAWEVSVDRDTGVIEFLPKSS